MGKKKIDGSLGNLLLKSRFSKASKIREPGGGSGTEKWLHTSELASDDTDWNKLNLRSVTEQSSLDEFLTTAELAGTEFDAERLNLNFVKPQPNAGILSREEKAKIKQLHEQNLDLLRIPRKPVWKGTNYDAQTLQAKERESFLEWRRNLALAQDTKHLSMTPFEKNLEFWRQLWRVIERSDVIVQIVDARNPLLFYCSDLESYVKEIDDKKLNLLLINKSDFLTERQRLEWLRYFEKRQINVVFWSAVLATSELNENSDLNSDLDEIEEIHSLDEGLNSKNLDKLSQVDEDKEEEEGEDEDDLDGSKLENKFNLLRTEDESNSENEEESRSDGSTEKENQEETEENVDENEEELIEQEAEESTETTKICTEKEPREKKLAELKLIIQKPTTAYEISDEERAKCKILTRDELISLFKTVHKHVVDKAKPGLTTIGLVGYPNVGKSSTINALFKNKKVAVSETPGKTKHYQTLYVDDELLLCDCPGLVFPSFVSTRGELIINGILPIDQMRDYTEPINLVINHIPCVVFQMIYGIEMPKPKEDEDPNAPPSAERLCSVYSLSRGFMNQRGMPDVNRGSRYILKDYVNGKLLYCYAPPHIADLESFQEHRYEPSKEIIYLERLRKLQKKIEEKEKKPSVSQFDKEFFQSMQPKALTKGGIVGYYRQKNAVQRGAEVGTSQANGAVKASKKHFNANKREKLRRKTSHFDAYDF